MQSHFQTSPPTTGDPQICCLSFIFIYLFFTTNMQKYLLFQAIKVKQRGFNILFRINSSILFKYSLDVLFNFRYSLTGLSTSINIAVGMSMVLVYMSILHKVKQLQQNKLFKKEILNMMFLICLILT